MESVKDHTFRAGELPPFDGPPLVYVPRNLTLLSSSFFEKTSTYDAMKG